MWFVFALMSALFASVRKTNEKQLSHKLNHFTIGWTVQLLSLPVIFIALLCMGQFLNPFQLDFSFWAPTLIVCIGFYPINTFLLINALKHGELSKILPLQSLGPIFALLLGWMLINQRPSVAAAVGIAIIVFGVYVLNLKGKYLHNPLKIFTADKVNLYTLLSLLLATLAGVLDTIAMRTSEPIYYSFVSTIGGVIVLYLTSLLFKVNELSGVKQSILPLGITGTLFGASYTTYLLALNLGPLAYVTAARSSGALMGALIGIIYLKESLNKKQSSGLGAHHNRLDNFRHELVKRFWL